VNKIWWVVLVVIVIGAWWAYSNKVPSLSSLPGLGGLNQSSPTPVAGTTAKSVAKKSTATPAPSGNYTALVKEYEGRRIQFDERCQVTPQSPTYKNGTSVMLDNRSASARAIMVGGTKYDLIAYGYRIVTLSSPSLPKEMAVSCGSSGNVGKILLQAQILQ